MRIHKILIVVAHSRIAFSHLSITQFTGFIELPVFRLLMKGQTEILL